MDEFETSDQSARPLVISGYVWVPSDMVLSFIVVERTMVTSLVTIYGAREIEQKLLDRVPADTVVQELKAIQGQAVQFPVEDLQSVSWHIYTNSFKFHYTQETRSKRFESFLNPEADRTVLLTLLRSHFSYPFQYESKPDALKVSWSYLLGVLLSLRLF